MLGRQTFESYYFRRMQILNSIFRTFIFNHFYIFKNVSSPTNCKVILQIVLHDKESDRDVKFVDEIKFWKGGGND